ncbi:hypothetical protein V8B97DRAFT_1008463 [Scleroderma yunnanense]
MDTQVDTGDMEGLEMDGNNSEGSASDGDDSDEEFYYDAALDCIHKALPDHQVAHFSSSTTLNSENGTHGPSDPSLLADNRTTTSLKNSAESTGAELTTSDDGPTCTPVPTMQMDECMPPPVHGCMPFTGPVVPLVSFAQYSEMSKEDGWEYICQLHAQIQALVTTVTSQAAQLEASNAHCTMAKYEISTVQDQQVSKNKGKARTMKFSSRYVTHPDMKDKFESQRKEKEEKAAREAEATAKKRAENEARMSRIDHDVVLKTFDSPLSTYKRKDDLVTIARALQIAVESKDTITALSKKIRAHMDEDPTITQNSRFSALFGEPHRGRRSKQSSYPANRSNARRAINYLCTSLRTGIICSFLFTGFKRR